jgi:hypothetical protein
MDIPMIIGFAVSTKAALQASALSALLCVTGGTLYSMGALVNPHSHLDEVAATFTSRDAAPQDIAALANAVFALPHFALMEDVLLEAINIVRQKFAAAEQGYWKGQHRAVREQDIVAAVNGVAAELNLPEYAKTSQAQIRHLRMGMRLRMNPRFMGLRLVKAPQPGEKATLLDEMSPLQAYHLVLSLIDQKFVEPFYQLSPEEWEQRSHTAPAVRSGPRITTTWDNPRAVETQERVREALGSLSDAQGLAILFRTLTALGIE